MNPERKTDATTETLKNADRRLTEIEEAVKAGRMSIGVALASAVLLGAELERLAK